MNAQGLSQLYPNAILGTWGWRPGKIATIKLGIGRISQSFLPRSLRLTRAEAVGESQRTWASLNLDSQGSDVKLAVNKFEEAGNGNGPNGALEARDGDTAIAPRAKKDKGSSSSSNIRKKKKKGGVEDDAERYKLRNGRQVFEERVYLVGIERIGGDDSLFGIVESLDELSQLADTAGLIVVGSTYQKLPGAVIPLSWLGICAERTLTGFRPRIRRLDSPNPRTYIGSGKVEEVLSAIRALDVETVVFDDELSPRQLRNLEKAFGGEVRVCDRTTLILDIFNQRAVTREAAIQVTLAQMEYQLPRLTRMWSHLERQAGGMVKGMGEKQIEVDKRILRDQIASLRKELESVRKHRRQYRNRRSSVPIPVVSLVGYTNAGKSTLLNRLTGASVLVEDRLFATLDPTTRRMELPNGKECLFTDTVGFIQKLPTQLVAAFRATLEEVKDSSLLVHVADISHPLAQQQMEAVKKVLAELDIDHIPHLTLWNKVDKAIDPDRIGAEAEHRDHAICISALTGDGLQDFCAAIEQKLKESMVWVVAFVPYDKGELVSIIHHLGIVEQMEYVEEGTLVKAHVPLPLARQLIPMRQPCAL